MNPRTTMVLLVLNAVVLVGLFLTRGGEEASGPTRLVPEDTDLASATAIRFSAGEGCPAFGLVRTEEGRWRLETTDRPLANQAAVEGLLADLRRAPILPFEVGAGHDLGLRPPRRTVSIAAGERSLLELEVGRPHPLGLGVYVRTAGEETPRLTFADLVRLLDRRPGDFRELRVFPFSPLDVIGFALRRETLDGPQEIEAERKWLTWFMTRPRRVRGTDAFDRMVSALLGIRRQGATPAPAARPALVATLRSATDTVTLQLWVKDERQWIGRVQGEEGGFPVNGLELVALRRPVSQIWDHRLFHDSARRLERVEWSLAETPPIALFRDPGVADVWHLDKPRTAAGDTEACNQFVQELVRLEVDGLEPAGTRPDSVGLDPPFGRLVLAFSAGAGEVEFRIGTVREGQCRIVSVRDPENIFRLDAAKLELLPRSALALVDRTVYRGNWKVVGRLDLRRGPAESYRLENVGQTDDTQWRRTDVAAPGGGRDGFVAGTPVRNLITYLTEQFRAERVLAWSRADAAPEWGVDRPEFRIRFRDTDPRQNHFIEIAIGVRQEDRSGRSWYPVWHEGEALPGHSYVYRIGDELVRKLRAVLPD